MSNCSGCLSEDYHCHYCGHGVQQPVICDLCGFQVAESTIKKVEPHCMTCEDVCRYEILACQDCANHLSYTRHCNCGDLGREGECPADSCKNEAFLAHYKVRGDIYWHYLCFDCLNHFVSLAQLHYLISD